MASIIETLFKKSHTFTGGSEDILPSPEQNPHGVSCEFGEESEHLVKLRELTRKLKGVPASQIVGHRIGPTTYTMQTDKGDQSEIEIFPLYFDGILRIERSIVPKGHRVKAHYHEGEIQHISVVRGSATVKMCPPDVKPKTYKIRQGRSIYIPAMVPHNFSADEDCYIVNVFMPTHGSHGMLRSKPTVKETVIENGNEKDTTGTVVGD